MFAKYANIFWVISFKKGNGRWSKEKLQLSFQNIIGGVNDSSLHLPTSLWWFYLFFPLIFYLIHNTSWTCCFEFSSLKNFEHANNRCDNEWKWRRWSSLYHLLSHDLFSRRLKIYFFQILFSEKCGAVLVLGLCDHPSTQSTGWEIEIAVCR